VGLPDSEGRRICWWSLSRPWEAVNSNKCPVLTSSHKNRPQRIYKRGPKICQTALIKITKNILFSCFLLRFESGTFRIKFSVIFSTKPVQWNETDVLNKFIYLSLKFLQVLWWWRASYSRGQGFTSREKTGYNDKGFSWFSSVTLGDWLILP
jgi:hypothetical protein